LIFCHANDGSFAKQLESNRRPNSSHDFSLDFFIAKAAAFHASVFSVPGLKSDDDLYCTNDSRPQCGGAVPAPLFEKWAEIARQLPRGSHLVV